MKVKSVLFLISSILRIAVASIGIFLSSMMFVVQGVVTEVLLESSDIVTDFISSLISADPVGFAYLKDYTFEQSIEYMMNIMKIIFGIILVISVIWLVFGVINIMLSKKSKYGLEISKSRKIIFVILSWLFSGGFVSNVITTIALFLRGKDTNTKLYSQNFE